VTVTTAVDATKQKIDSAEALKLLAGAERLLSAKGSKLDDVNLKKNRPDDDTLLGLMMGPTGNLRAPTARVGKTIVVGFNEAAYEQVLGK
jgi:arsenate reductase-like glutaredoxin family protein